MKMSRIALAMLVAAPLAAANAGVTVTPLMLGYTWQDTKHNNTGKLPHGDYAGAANILELQDDLFVGAALGVELTPWLGFEAEYSQVKGDIEFTPTGADVAEYKKTQLAGNFYATSDLITKNYDSKIKPYVLLGAGHVKYKAEGETFEEGTIGNAGVGAFWRLNDALSLRTEARGTFNFDREFWDYTALAGLNVVLGGHLKPAAPVVEVAPVAPIAPVAPAPQELTEDLNMELRVFFDTNKSNIKDQYKPEIAKVAEKLVEYPNATARIEGHTDNTGPRALNERLSLARANSVKSSLVNEYNVDPARLSTQGFAWDQPIADNNTKEGRAMNRRVFATITGSRTVTVEQQAQ
ncbi:OmpA family protein [Acinetobacter towneri]|uniref:outer membrane protein Omp38 n=1 Tax=Acinetobacter towneri TaxID=202956 RepID=UPI001CE0E790|nr:OmpA family protein [Acinetobacter towneri]MCA4780252.1 OmpA family protein [Acinetobacter towneri]MCA4785619.1 OmpA family protein [Acinetobacter towneri]MCA4788011.1 OmpA family protein [Acinetobacter towneri]MCA4796733.1 OmpA family protein [Acinetobacter towneri]MCA4801805.1 OmpA family protein [Acinetobacter towneri]